MNVCFHERCNCTGAFRMVAKIWPKASQVQAEGFKPEQIRPLSVQLMAPVCLLHALQIIADPTVIMVPSLWMEIEAYAAVAGRWHVDRNSLKLEIVADGAALFDDSPEPNAAMKPKAVKGVKK